MAEQEAKHQEMKQLAHQLFDNLMNMLQEKGRDEINNISCNGSRGFQSNFWVRVIQLAKRIELHSCGLDRTDKPCAREMKALRKALEYLFPDRF